MLEVNPGAIKLTDVAKHPLGLHYLCEYAVTQDAALAKTLRVLEGVEAYKRKNVPQKKMEKAAKIYKEFIVDNPLFPKEVQQQIAEQVEADGFAAEAMFQPVESILSVKADPLLAGFKKSSAFNALISNFGTKIMTVSSKDQADENVEIEGEVIVGRSRTLQDTGGITLGEDHKVSREHCRLDVGPLVVLVTDLGSSKGTKLDSKSGKKVTAEVLIPGQARPLPTSVHCRRPLPTSVRYSSCHTLACPARPDAASRPRAIMRRRFA